MTNHSWLDRSRGSLGVFIVIALVLGLVGLAAAELPPGGTFVDDDGNIHEGNIEAIAADGITRGCNPPTNDRYCPSDRVTRGQMAAFLVRALGLTEGLDDPFIDDDGSVFESDIERLAAAGVTRGCNPPTNDRFCPDDYVTRGQMAAFLVRAMGYTDDGGGDLFIDDDDSVFEADIDRLGTAGVTKGCNPPTNDRFCPTDYVLRDQMASFLARALGLNAITPPTTTIPGTTPTTLPELGSSWIGACGTDDRRHSFTLDESCIEVGTPNRYANAQIVATWYGPDGAALQPCEGSCQTVEYYYNAGVLTGWSFFFYVAGEERDPGWYRFELRVAGTTGQPLVRTNFELVHPGTPTTSYTTTTTTEPSTTSTPTTATTLPSLESVAWSCVEDSPGNFSCSGNTDTSDPGDESWVCVNEGSPESPFWYCSGDIDKSDASAETWECSAFSESCEGDVDGDDGDEFWYYDSDWAIGDVGGSPGEEEWVCAPSGTGLSCEFQDCDYAGAWSCELDAGIWSCSGQTGSLAPAVGPIPMFHYIFGLG